MLCKKAFNALLNSRIHEKNKKFNLPTELFLK